MRVNKPVSLLLFLSMNCGLLFAQQSPLWGHLTKGKYNVGFVMMESYDMTRPPVREQLSLNPEQQLGRAIQINIWYPTLKNLPKVKFRHYLNLTGKEIDIKQNDRNDSDLINVISIEQNNSHGIEIDKDALNKILQLDLGMEAMLNATPLKEKFPIILIGSETAFKWCVIAEYLASHGYVVVASPNTGSTEKLQDFERTLVEQAYFVNAEETSIDDLQHVLSVVKKLKYVDSRLIGVLGYSGGVATGLGLITTGVKAKAVVSLEGSIGGYYGPKVLSQTHSYSSYLITQPILHFFSPSYGYNHVWLDSTYTYSDRTVIAVYPIRHEDFTTYGALEEFASGISGKAQKPPRPAFEIAAQYTLNFFNAHVLGDATALEFINSSLERNSIPLSFQEGVPEKWKGIKRMPGNKTFDEYQLKAMYDADGFKKIQETYSELAQRDPRPFSAGTFFNFSKFLKNDQEKNEWFTDYLQCYQSSAEAHFLLAQTKEKLNEIEIAIKHYNKALELFNSNEDILLRDIFVRRITGKLKILTAKK